MRDLTRHRVKLCEERNRIHNRIEKVLQDASLKLSTVAKDILGVTGRAIIAAIIAGQEHPDWLADKAKSRLRSKRNQLRQVLRGKITEHHRWMLRELMKQLNFVEERIVGVEQELVRRMQPYEALIERLDTIPGVDVVTAWTLIAELGPDMSVFADAKHAASWAGLCPGNYQSAGKRLSNRTRKGNRWIRRALCQAAWAASRKKSSYLTALFFRQAARHGRKKAAVATAHQILMIAYHILRDGTVYRELGGNYFDTLHPERTQKRLVARLERLGFQVSVRPRSADSNPSQGPHANA